MNSWKERIADKLSQLLSDAPSSPDCGVDAKPQALPFAEDDLSPKKRSNFSSFLLSMIPATCSDAGRVVSSSPQDLRLSPSHSYSRSWKYSSFGFKGRPLENVADGGPEGHGDFTAAVIKENTNNVSERSANAAERIVELSFSNDPGSTMKHGISLRTLIRNSASLAGPCLLIVGDMQGAIFGGLLDSPLKPTVKRKYQGTNQAFVFTTIYGQPRLFRATGANRFYYLCLNDFLAFGGGGSFAIALEEDLLNGTSGPCETFGNLCLAHSEEFELKNVELWGFTHSSRYII